MRQTAYLMIALPALALAACSKPADKETAAPTESAAMTDAAPDSAAEGDEGAQAVDFAAARSGLYTVDPGHHQLLFNYLHQGYSLSWVRWSDWTSEINWNAEDPEASTVTVTVNVPGIDTGVPALDDHLKSAGFFDAENNPQITFSSTSLERTGPTTGKLAGDLTIKGVTRPVTLDVTINKAGFDERNNAYKLGFSAKGTLSRSEFGLGAYVPIVGDEINFIVEAEYLSPAEVK